MGSSTAPRALDAAGLMYEVGRLVQALALTMRRHRLVPGQQLCECGRLPVHPVPLFGARCDVARDAWALAHEAMRRVVQTAAPAVGRARVGRRG